MTSRHSIFLISSRPPFVAEAERTAAGEPGAPAIRVAGKTAPATGAAAPAGIEALRTGAATAILIDLDSGLTDGLRVLEQICQTAPDARVLVTSANRDPDLILHAMRTGAADFLPLPLDRPALTSALERAARHAVTEAGQGAHQGRVMSFLSVKGGCGATSIAVNLGVSLCARRAGRRRSVVVVDLDTPGGDVTTMLKLQASYSLSDVAAGIHRLDMDLLNSMALHHESGLVCIAAAGEGERKDEVTPDQMAGIITFLREHHDEVILAGGGLGPVDLAAINQAHMVHLVTTLDFLALKRARNMTRRLREFGVTGDSLRVVVNRLERGSDLTLRDAREALDAPVVWSIPADAITAGRAANEGVPFVMKGKSRLMTAFDEYASLLQGREEGAGSDRKVGRLLKRLVPGRAGMPA